MDVEIPSVSAPRKKRGPVVIWIFLLFAVGFFAWYLLSETSLRGPLRTLLGEKSTVVEQSIGEGFSVGSIITLPAETVSFSGPPWQVTLRKGSEHFDVFPSLHDQVVQLNESNREIYLWKGIRTAAGLLTVQVTKETQQASLRFVLEATLAGDHAGSIENVLLYAHIKSKEPGKAELQTLMVPTFLGGKTLHNPYHHAYEKAWYASGVWQLPFVLLYNEGAPHEGLSLRVEDTDGQLLTLLTEVGNGSLNLGMGSSTRYKATSITTPLVVVELYKGKDYEGVQLYRKWALQQRWIKPVPSVEHNRHIPELLKNAPFMVVIGTYDKGYDVHYFERLFSYYRSLAGPRNTLAVAFLASWDNRTAFPEAYATRLPGLTEVVALANEEQILPIAYASLNVQPTTMSGIRRSDFAIDCQEQLRVLELFASPAYAINPNAPGMNILDEVLITQIVPQRWKRPEEAFKLLFIDHFDPEKHDTCAPRADRKNVEVMQGMERFFERMAERQPWGFGYATEVLFDRYLRWAPMSNALDGDRCVGPGDANSPFLSYAYSDRSLRTSSIMLDNAVDLNRGYSEQLFQTIVTGKLPFFLDVQQLASKQFFSVQVLPTLEKALRETSVMFPVWKRFVRFGQKLPDLENVQVPLVPREVFGYTSSNCHTAQHPVVMHGVFKYEQVHRDEWGIVLLNWNDVKAPILSTVNAPSRRVLLKSTAFFSGVFDPQRYGVPADGSYWVFRYNKDARGFEKLGPVIGPTPIAAEVDQLSGELFVIRKA